MSSKRSGFPRWVWFVLAVLLPLCVPWYVSDTQPSFWGFPFWSWVVLVFSILLASFTAYIFIYLWQEEAPLNEKDSVSLKESEDIE